MAEGIRAKVRKALAELDHEIDFVSGFAAPLALSVIADVLEVPDADRELFRSFVQPVLDLTNGEEVTPEVLGAYFAGMTEFAAYFGRTQLFTELPERDRLALCLALVVAGTDSTTNLLSSLVLRLGEGAAPVEGFVEEVIRLESPFRGFFRTATTDTAVGGVRVAEGEHLFLDFAAGNRDTSVFDEVLDPQRPPVPPHLGFGYGTHYCLGAQLARTEARVVVEEVLGHGVELVDAAAAVRYRRHLISHGPAELMVRPAKRPG
ncbi:cytochrome P450 [Lentzea tibetensis]|nr:cytochrome P450 [Lentzea tibetensis]